MRESVDRAPADARRRARHLRRAARSARAASGSSRRRRSRCRSTSAALMPPMLELAGEIADGVILNFMPVEAVPRMLEHVRERRGARRPRSVDSSRSSAASRPSSPTTSPAARGALAPHDGAVLRDLGLQSLRRLVRVRRRGGARSWPAGRRRTVAATSAAVTDEMIDRLAIIGTADALPRAPRRPSPAPVSPRRWCIPSCSTKPRSGGVRGAGAGLSFAAPL